MHTAYNTNTKQLILPHFTVFDTGLEKNLGFFRFQ